MYSIEPHYLIFKYAPAAGYGGGLSLPSLSNHMEVDGMSPLVYIKGVCLGHRTGLCEFSPVPIVDGEGGEGPVFPPIPIVDGGGGYWWGHVTSVHAKNTPLVYIMRKPDHMIYICGYWSWMSITRPRQKVYQILDHWPSEEK